MKKILTASLVAMMAVSAARAEIASTGYVDGKVKVNADAIAAMDTAYKAADTAINTKIGTVTEGKTVVQMITEAVSGGSSDALADANEYTDTEVGKVSTALGEYKTSNDAAVALKADKTALEAEKKAREEFDTAINTTIGTLPVGQESVVAYIADVAANAGTGASDALAGAKGYTDEKVGALADGAVKANTEAIAALDTTYVSESEMSTFKTLNTEAIADAKKAGTDAAAALGAYETANDLALAGVKATAEAAQVKSTAFSIGNAEGKWTAFTAIPGYCTTGTCSLTTVDGAPTWVLVK